MATLFGRPVPVRGYLARYDEMADTSDRTNERCDCQTPDVRK